MSWERIAKARRRLAREVGTISKDWGGRIPIALVYPNSYYVGMSSLGFQTVHGLLNRQDNIVCERAFYDPSDPSSREEPLLSLESQRELSEFAVIAFSVSFELDYFNVISSLRGAKIPLLAEERTEAHPLVMAGGPCVFANPEPLAPFFDALIIGEAEAILPGVISELEHHISDRREELLAALAKIPGVYIPKFYEVEYATDGSIASIKRKRRAIPLPVQRQWALDLDDFATTSVVLTPDTELGDMYLIEIARGCSRGCRFCLAGYSYRPMRERSVARLLEQAKDGMRYRRRIGLVGAAISDYSAIGELSTGLRRLGAKVAVASLRIDPQSEQLLNALVESGIRTITIAPETGSERLQRLINKNISIDEVLRAIDLIAHYKIDRVKLYYMVGLPTETEEDVKEVSKLTLAIKRRIEKGGAAPNLTVNLTPFVPKAQTPFQWLPMLPSEEMTERIHLIKMGLKGQQGIVIRVESPAWATVQAALARGDRRMARALSAIHEVSTTAWVRAMKESGLDQSFYTTRQRQDNEVLPWSTIDVNVSKAFLRRELVESERLLVTDPCPARGCRKCGVCPPDFARIPAYN
ncbi:MAG: radical SAM protein [Chloroflexi bacterium]|nr:radical SAM protein [Chloroflexota bacterium]MCL5075638.1 radical SAM protein [Chloroflexota bacterium]